MFKRDIPKSSFPAHAFSSRLEAVLKSALQQQGIMFQRPALLSLPMQSGISPYSWIDNNNSTNSISEIKGVHIDSLSAADVTLGEPELHN